MKGTERLHGDRIERVGGNDNGDVLPSAHGYVTAFLPKIIRKLPKSPEYTDPLSGNHNELAPCHLC